MQSSFLAVPFILANFAAVRKQIKKKKYENNY